VLIDFARSDRLTVKRSRPLNVAMHIRP